ncbi:MAG: PaaI family thioesterase [Rhizobiales bacterium]|nr:PaaI family thioesterase [Hyphomicrobiales bacterium]
MAIATDGSVDPEKLRRFEERPHAFYRLIGARITYLSRDRVEAELTVTDDISNTSDIIHGGAVVAFADHLGGAATIVNLEAGQRTATIESKINFFGPVPTGQKARAVCTPLHKGRTTMVWETRVTREDGKLAALVIQTQMVIAAGSTAGSAA